MEEELSGKRESESREVIAMAPNSSSPFCNSRSEFQSGSLHDRDQKSTDFPSQGRRKAWVPSLPAGRFVVGRVGHGSYLESCLRNEDAGGGGVTRCPLAPQRRLL